jgi:hypothetical protein
MESFVNLNKNVEVLINSNVCMGGIHGLKNVPFFMEIGDFTFSQILFFLNLEYT